MKGYRFYLEFVTTKDKRNNAHSGNVFAHYHGEGIETSEVVTELRYHLEGVGAVFSHPNSDVCGTSCDRGFLQTRCKRISEKKARLIHPNLFTYLDCP